MQGEPWSGEHRRGIAVCGLLKTTNSAASSKQAHFFRHWRRIACFPCFSIRPAAGGRFAKQIKEAPIKRGHPLGCPLFIGAGGGTRTHTVSPPTDFEWLYRFCFPQQSALHRSQKALILLAFLTFSCFY